jgi:phosphomannomutase / phosphoglucomutase
MNKSSGKVSALQQALAQAARPERVGKLLDPRFLLLLTATLAFGAALFCAWQTWLVFSEIRGADEAERVRQWEVQALDKFVADTRSRVIEAINSDTVNAALATPGDETHSAATAALKQALPDLIAVDFYRADLEDVLKSEFSKFGYAKAAILVQAHQFQRGAPIQSRATTQKQRLLVFALPVLHEKQVVAFAYVELPFEPMLQIFRQASVADARIDLRQGDGRGDLLLDSIGSKQTPASLSDPGLPVGGSLFRVGSVAEEFFIVFPHALWLTLLLTLLAFGVGIFLLRVRAAGLADTLARLRGQKVVRGAIADEPTLAQSLPKEPTPAAAKAKPAPKLADTDVAVDRSIFRAYDIRGVLGKTLTTGVARQIGRAIGSEAQQRGLKEIAVGRDGRLSGPDLSGALIEGLRAAGCDVIDIGAAPTPVLYFATYHLNIGSGVMVTGSHNPPDYNGFKIVLGGETLAESAIQDLYMRISENRYTSGSGGLQTMVVTRDYIERITGDVQVEHKMKVVVDCGNGIAGAVVPAVLEGVGCEVLPLYCEVDGEFPNHHPDPSDPDNLQDLILTVKRMNADLGLAFDGDGDRLGVVTASGEIIYPDRLLMLFARDVLTRNPGATIIYDVKCTGKLQPLILQAGGSPIMWKTGHSLIKSKMRETDAELAGEMSGHFFFRERWYGFDDGIYSAARLVEILAADNEGRTPQQIFDSLPKGVSTPELKIEMVEGEHYRFIEKFKEKSSFEGARVTTIDGVRADWPDGWGLVRASNTTPVLVLRFDADNDAALQRIQDAFRRQLLALDPKLTLPF